jgi:hypothetical protein
MSELTTPTTVEAGVSPAIPPQEKLTKKAITADAGGSRSPLRDVNNVGEAETCLASPSEKSIHRHKSSL